MTDAEMIAGLTALRNVAALVGDEHTDCLTAAMARLAELSALADPDALTIAHLAAHHSRDEEVRKLSAERDAARAEAAKLREALEETAEALQLLSESMGAAGLGDGKDRRMDVETGAAGVLTRARTALAGGRDDDH